MSLTSLLSTQDQDALLGNDDSSTSSDDESSALSNDDESSVSDSESSSSGSESSSSDSEVDESSSESEYEYDENEMASDDESPTAPNEGEEGNQVTDDSFESNSSGNDGSSSGEPEPKRLRHESDGEQSSDEHDDQGQGEYAQREPVLDRIRRNREEAQRRMRPQGADTGAETRPDGRINPSATYDRIYQLATDPNQTPVIESCPTAVPDFIAQNCPYNSQIDNACNQVGLNRAFTDCLGEGRHDIVFGCFANYCPTTREQAFNERILHKVTKILDDGTEYQELRECWKFPTGILRDIMVGEYNMQEQGMCRGYLL